MAAQAAQGIGSVVGAAGALVQGQAQANALDRAAEIERNNAALDIQAGEENAAISSIKSNQHIGAIQAGAGASGISQDSGSILDVLAASTANAELDRQNIMHGAKVRAINYENQAAMDEAGAKSAVQGSYFNALGSVLQGGSKVFGDSAGVSPGAYKPIKQNGYDGVTTDSGGSNNPYSADS